MEKKDYSTYTLALMVIMWYFVASNNLKKESWRDKLVFCNLFYFKPADVIRGPVNNRTTKAMTLAMKNILALPLVSCL